MKVKTLLAQAARCATEEEAQALLDVLKEHFEATSALKHLDSRNDQVWMEDEYRPFINFELNRVISSSYIIGIRPEIRDAKLVVVVAMNRMLDKLGMESQSWEIVDDMEEVIDGEPDDTVASLARKAKDLALEFHAKLLEELGVPEKVALQAAKKSW